MENSVGFDMIVNCRLTDTKHDSQRGFSQQLFFQPREMDNMDLCLNNDSINPLNLLFSCKYIKNIAYREEFVNTSHLKTLAHNCNGNLLYKYFKTHHERLPIILTSIEQSTVLLLKITELN